MTARESRMIAWLDHARGCRRRSWEYLRNAIEDAAAGRHHRSGHYHNLARQSRKYAWQAIRSAKLEREMA
jgi:hypothetical protein